MALEPLTKALERSDDGANLIEGLRATDSKFKLPASRHCICRPRPSYFCQSFRHESPSYSHELPPLPVAVVLRFGKVDVRVVSDKLPFKNSIGM